MSETCPVCDAAVEHVRIEERTESDGTGDDGIGGTASFDVADLCAVEEDTRWDRICTVATSDSDQASPALEVYYHFFEE